MGTVPTSQSKLLYKFRVNAAAYSSTAIEMYNLAYSVNFNYITDDNFPDPPVPCSITTNYTRTGSYDAINQWILFNLNYNLHAATFSDPVILTIGPS